MTAKSLLRTTALAACLLASAAAHAGRTCETENPAPETLVLATRMAEQTLAVLNTLPDDVVLLGRVGQDLSAYNLKYSHMAFAMRTKTGWNIVHELNKCGTAEASLYDQGMVDFFSDTPFKYEAGIWRVSPLVQARIEHAVTSKVSSRMHEPHYSLLAYPFSTKYQNSNQWVLEVLAYAVAPDDEVQTRGDAQNWLQKTGYVPTELQIGTLKRLGARVTKANIEFDDHPGNLRWAGHIRTVTVVSVIDYLKVLPGVCAPVGCAETNVVLSTGSGE